MARICEPESNKNLEIYPFMSESSKFRENSVQLCFGSADSEHHALINQLSLLGISSP